MSDKKPLTFFDAIPFIIIMLVYVIWKPSQVRWFCDCPGTGQFMACEDNWRSGSREAILSSDIVIAVWATIPTSVEHMAIAVWPRSEQGNSVYAWSIYAMSMPM